MYKDHVTELYHLKPEDRQQYFEEMIRVAQALDKSFQPDKMNYFIFGNVVAHLHWHLIPRYKTDPSWGGPVDFTRKKKLKDEEYKNHIENIRKNL
jgi:diadenosine tetraphosphate (Ap4A) HIT family hydrolase